MKDIFFKKAYIFIKIMQIFSFSFLPAFIGIIVLFTTLDGRKYETYFGYPANLVIFFVWVIIFALIFHQYLIYITLTTLKGIIQKKEIKKYQLVLCVIWGILFSCIFNIIIKNITYFIVGFISFFAFIYTALFSSF